MVEQRFCKAQVASSNLVRGSQCSIAQLVVREAVNFEVLGSSPSGAVMKPAAILLIISALEDAHHNCRINGFDEDKDALREMCTPYYKLYFKLKREANEKTD